MEKADAQFSSLCSDWKRLLHFLISLALVAIVILSIMRNVFLLVRAFAFERDTSVIAAADYIHSSTPDQALVETYDKELVFLLNRRCHYPPDQIQLQLNQRTFAGEDMSVNYNPLQANPDLIEVGPHTKLWRLYDEVLKQGRFKLVKSIGRYEVYRKVG